MGNIIFLAPEKVAQAVCFCFQQSRASRRRASDSEDISGWLEGHHLLLRGVFFTPGVLGKPMLVSPTGRGAGPHKKK